MATYDFALTRDQIIEAALRKVGMIDPEGQTPSATLVSNSAIALNAMAKSWQADGLQIWTRRIGTIFLQDGQASYQLGASGGTGMGGDHATLSYVETSLPSGASSGATSLTVSSISGISDNDYIGITLDTGLLFWTTVNGTPTGTTVVVDDALTSDANDNAVVYAYTNKLAKPIRVNDGYIRQSNDFDTPVRIISKEEYNRFGNKAAEGIPTQVMWEVLADRMNVYCYPVPSDSTLRLYLELHYPFSDFDSSAQLADFPSEWSQALIWGLAYELGFEAGLEEKRIQMIGQTAKYWRDLALGASQENSVYFQPDINWR